MIVALLILAWFAGMFVLMLDDLDELIREQEDRT